MPLRRIGRWTLGIIGGLLLLAATSALVVETPWFKERLRRIVVERANEALNAQLSVGRLAGSLWSGVELHDVVLVQTAGPVFAARRISLRYDPRILMRGHLTFIELAVHEPVIHVVERANGWNVATLGKPSTGKRSTRIEFQKLSIAGGDVRVAPLNGTVRHLQDLNASLELSYTPERLLMNIGGLNAREVDTGLVIRSATGQLTNQASGLAARFNVDSSAGAFSGTFDGPRETAGRTLRVHATVAHLNAAPLLARRDLITDVTGRVEVQRLLPPSPTASAPLSFQIDAQAVSALGYDAQNVRGLGSYEGGVLRFDVAGNAYGARTKAKGEWHSAASKRRPNSIQVAGDVSGLDLRRVPRKLQVPQLASRLAGRYELNYGPGAWSASMVMNDSLVEGAQIGAGAVAHAAMRAGTPTYDFKGRVARLDLQRLAGPLQLATLRESRFKSQISGFVDMTGSGRNLDQLALQANATLDDSTIGPTRLPGSQVAAQIASRRLVVDFSGSFEHVSEVWLGTPKTPMDLNGSTPAARLVIEDLRAPVSVETLSVEGNVTLERSKLQGYDVDRAVVDASLLAGTATVRSLTVEGPQLHATAAGVVAISGNSASDFTFTIDADTLETPAKLSGRPISGGGRVEGKVTGPPNQLTATGKYDLRQFKYGTSVDTLTLNGTFSADVKDQQWRDGTFRTDATATFVKVGGQNIDQVTAKAVYHQNNLDIETRLDQKGRSVEMTGNVAFEPEQEEIKLRRLALATANQTWTLPAGREATIRYGMDRIAIENLGLMRDAQLVEVKGSLGVGDREIPASGVDVRLENVLVADINQLFAGTRKLSGVVNGTARIEGSTASPRVTSKLTVANGTVETTPFQMLSADVALREGEVTLDAVLDVQPGMRLTAVGTLPGPTPTAGAPAEYGDRPMNLKINSTSLDLGIFQALTAEITELKGTGQFDLHVTGTPRAPRVAGAAAIENASFLVATTGVAYQAGQAKLRFDGDHVLIDQFTLADDDGHTLTATGGAEVAGGRDLRSVDLHVVSDNLHLMRNPYGDVVADADIKATGPLRQLDITGEARFSKTRLDVDKILERLNKNAYAEEAAPGPAPDLPADAAAQLAQIPQPTPESPDAHAAEAMSGTLFDNARINVKLTMPDDVVLRASDLRVSNGGMGLGSTNVTVGGTLTLEKPRGGDLSVVGVISVVRGFYDFQGRRFDIERGSEVQFRGNRPVDPALNVTGTRDISGVTTEVGVRGTARNPSITLSSYPPLDESDILSLIVFGQPVNALGESQRVNLAERAGSLALGAVAGPIAESVGRALNLDLFEIRAEGAGGAPEIALGSQVGSRVFIGLRQEFGRDEMSAVSFEYRLSRLLRLVTSVAQGSERTHSTRRTDPTGVDLIFVYRY
jgi:autotransporter translocation and assembly factor TamB